MDIHQAMRQAKASVDMVEGFYIKPEHDRLIFGLLSGLMTEEEFEEQVMLLLEGTQ